MFAALPMYDWPQVSGATDALWSHLRGALQGAGIAAPETLNRDLSHAEGWARPDLLLGQICNLPYRAGFVGKVHVLGAMDFGLIGCAPGFYQSVIVCRAEHGRMPLDRLLIRPFAFNDPLSQSGWGSLWTLTGDLGVSAGPGLQTGSHRASIEAVADGRADYAAIDAITWRLALMHLPAARSLRVLGQTPTSPGMTLITAAQDPEPIRAALTRAFADLPQIVQRQLGLRGLVQLPASAYDMPLPPAPPQQAALQSA